MEHTVSTQPRTHTRATRGMITAALWAALCGAGCMAELRAEDPPTAGEVATRSQPSTPSDSPPAGQAPTGAMKGDRLLYTTYFYTANEAVVHGYEKDTKVRIISLEQGGTIWEGEVQAGQTKLIPTGKGVFSFVSDKKASILVGTPSRCAVVGYWVRDRDGSFRSDHFISQLPSQSHFASDRVLIWAWEDAEIQVTDTTADKLLFKGKVSKGGYHELERAQVAQLPSHVIEVRTSGGKKDVAVQVYYDEGFFVPSKDGRAAGTEFMTYVGTTTTGHNDLQLFSYGGPAKVTVEDIKAKSILWQGQVAGDSVHNLTLADKFVRITSDREISASVTPYKHYVGPYQEHHYGAGQEGTGIENNFLITTPQELWIFSYFDQNPVTVTDMTTGKVVWEGTLNKNKPVGPHPGHGFYRVRSAKGISVMGGAEACGAEYSPAGKLFELDESLLKVVQQIKEERIERAKKEGRSLSAAEAAAPLSPAELKRARKAVNAASPRDYSFEEIDERSKTMSTY